jgi:hypothetical protein
MTRPDYDDATIGDDGGGETGDDEQVDYVQESDNDGYLTFSNDGDSKQVDPDTKDD